MIHRSLPAAWLKAKVKSLALSHDSWTWRFRDGEQMGLLTRLQAFATFFSVNRLITSIEIKLGIPTSHHFPLEQRKNIDSNLNLGKKCSPLPVTTQLLKTKEMPSAYQMLFGISFTQRTFFFFLIQIKPIIQILSANSLMLVWLH